MKQVSLIAVLGWLSFVVPARAEVSGGIDWSAWQRLPVLQDGRIMPLDSFARAQVKTICGDIHPTLGRLVGGKTNAEMKLLSPVEIKRRVRENMPHRFLAAELLYSWTVEPEKWDDVPFLLADDETLRADILDVPIFGEDGSRLKYVSPRQVRASKKFREIMDEIRAMQMEAQQKQRRPEFSALKDKARALYDAAEMFTQLSYDPARPNSANPWLENDFVGMQKSWDGFVEALSQHPSLTVTQENMRSGKENQQAQSLEKEFLELAGTTNQAMQGFVEQWEPVASRKKPVKSLEGIVAKLRTATSKMEIKLRELSKTGLPDPANLVKDNSEEIQSNRKKLCHQAKMLVLQATQLHWEIYNAGGDCINIVPAMEATAFEADRFRSEIRPWISLNAVLRGSPRVLADYPSEDVEKIRDAWQKACTAFLDGEEPERAGEFSAAMRDFTGAVRVLSTSIEPDRQQLHIVERDRGLLARTAYPPALTTDSEVLYNRADPFFWSGCTSLLAAGILGLSYFGLRKPLFWAGIATMLVSVVWILVGFSARVYITRWAPVTGMFETIVWVAMCSAVLLLWVTFLPLLGPTSKAAFALTAIPGSWEDRRNADGPPQGAPIGIRAAALALRLGLFSVGLCIALSYMGVLKFEDGSPIFDFSTILPHADLGSSTPNLSASLVWAASMFVATMFVWHLPRLIPSAIFAIPMSLALAGRSGNDERMEKIYRSRIVALFGALASFLASFVAVYAPFPKDIQALMPVLRSNFWLGIHVLTITSSYAAVGVSWVLGNLTLGFFAFGSYRTVASRRVAGEPSVQERRPPAFCGELVSMNYRVLQVAVLLLAAGTILGGLWADVSWGRFWGWDPKEVGALIALLAVLTALHGRRAGWPGDLSLAIGSICGFGGVIWAWYVVNFILNAGKHSYGAGEGGQVVWLVTLVAIQCLFVGTATARVRLETRKPAEIAMIGGNERPATLADPQDMVPEIQAQTANS
jgi:ABC-type transport system involved in cytochrome c biogenesis permease subunit